MNYTAMTDPAILSEVGARVQRERLNRNIAQHDLALKAGISRRALHNLESGRSCTLLLLIRVLRVLDKLESLDALLPAPGLSPLQLAKLKGRERQRAGGKRAGSTGR
jgi:putative transcriptional regulator